MTKRRLPRRALDRLLHPHTTVRWRLTLIYAGLFLACGAGLLAITYALVARADVLPQAAQFAVNGPGPPPFALPPGFLPPRGRARTAIGPLPQQVRRALRSRAGQAALHVVVANQRGADLRRLEVESGIALAIMTLISGLLGWIVAGRVLRPLRTITATTREISEASLHRRLALEGPPDELRQLADTIDDLLARLEAAFEAQKRFVANASHELRTPITAVRALLEMVMSDPHATVHTFRETCRQVLEENEQEERLIDALLTLAQGQRGTDRAEPVDLAGVTREAARALEREAALRGVTIETSLDGGTISGDPRLVERLVSNLLENAIRHNVPEGMVTASVESRGDRVVLHVANTGPVVPADQVERLLAPFQRLAPDRIGHDGLGLGLSIVAAIADAHHATLEVRPRARGGLDIRVPFPLAALAPASEPEPAPSFV